MADYERVALVTGGAVGIGGASARLLAQRGAAVVIGDVDAENGSATVDEIEKEGGTATFVEADVSLETDVERLVSTAIETYGRLDWAHNNAGIEGAGSLLHEMPTEEFDRNVSVNMRGIYLSMKHEIRHMLEQGSGGSIVNTASTAALVGFPGEMSQYVASKHGVAGLTKSSGLGYAQAGIRVNAIVPGVTRTPMMERFIGGDPEIEKQMHEMSPIGRMADPTEIAEAAYFLLSDRASFILGHLLVVDGGFTVP